MTYSSTDEIYNLIDNSWPSVKIVENPRTRWFDKHPITITIGKQSITIPWNAVTMEAIEKLCLESIEL